VSNDYYNKAAAITPSDTVNIAGGPPGLLVDAIYSGAGGTVAAVFQDDTVVNFTTVAGEILPIRIKRVNAAGTAATLLVALWTTP
jgi:hypothetical protein